MCLVGVVYVVIVFLRIVCVCLLWYLVGCEYLYLHVLLSFVVVLLGVFWVFGMSYGLVLLLYVLRFVFELYDSVVFM